jgi:UDP-glucose 4-epimerase
MKQVRKTLAARASGLRPGKGRRVLITGAAGYIGSLLAENLAESTQMRITGVDVREPRSKPDNVSFHVCDVSGPDLGEIMKREKPHIVVHLASIVSPPKNSDPEFEYRVDVVGTQNVLEACVRCNAEKIIVTSSGAAYGYHADNPEWLVESDPLRGNDSFPYSRHKRLVEEMLAVYRRKHPKLKQLILRPGTVLGAGTRNQITNLFEKSFVPGIAGSDSPFVLIWDQDVVRILSLGASTARTGIYNLAGDGKLTLREMARMLGKPFLPLPPSLLRLFFRAAKPLGLSRYGPEQIDFLRYRPVLSNDALKTGFGYSPQKTTREVFQYYIENRPRS